MHEWREWFDNSSLMLLAGVAGLLGWLVRSVENKTKITWLRALLEFAVACLLGILLVFLCREAGLSLNWTGAIVGGMSWVGHQTTTSLLQNLISRKLNVTLDSRNENDGNPGSPK